jgi:flagellar biosynthesis protein FlhB
MRDRQMVVRMRCIAGIRKVVYMLMMRIMYMTMRVRVRHAFVRMHVRVTLEYMKPDTERINAAAIQNHAFGSAG